VYKPLVVPGLSNQVEVKVNSLRVCSKGSDGSVHCWGYNSPVTTMVASGVNLFSFNENQLCYTYSATPGNLYCKSFISGASEIAEATPPGSTISKLIVENSNIIVI